LLYPKVCSDRFVAEFELFHTEIWLQVGFVVVFATIFTYLLNIYAIIHLTLSVAASYIYTQHAFVIVRTFFFSYIGWTEDFTGALTLEKVIFMLMIFAGVFLISRSALQERRGTK